jgi:hypothetical protein
MATIGTKGANLDLLIRQGATLGPVPCRLTNPDTSPMILTGSTFRGQIRKTPSSASSTGATAVCVITNATNGEFTFEFPVAATTALIADDVSEEAPASIYVWDLEIEDSVGRVTPIFYGTVKVFREVTKVDP